MTQKNTAIILTIVGIILLIPFIAMQFTQEVNWGIMDFVVGASILLIFGFAIDYTRHCLRRSKSLKLMIAGILIVLLILWAELAVGIFGSPLSGN
jgi:ABC-type cobalt transport system substrate-binding protein